MAAIIHSLVSTASGACPSPKSRCGTGQAGALACGLRIRSSIELDPAENVVSAARFSACGSGPCREALSAVSALLAGKALEHVQRLTHRDIADALQGAAERRMVHAVLVHEALNAALADCRGEVNPRAGSEPVICRCFAVREGMIQRVARMNGLTTVVEVTHYTSAASGCGACAADVQAVLSSVYGQATGESAARAGHAATSCRTPGGVRSDAAEGLASAP